RKVTQLEARFITDSNKIENLEARCNKYQKTSESLKDKAKNVLQMSQRFVNNTMERRNFSPPSHDQTTKNKTQSSFNLSQTETEKLVDSAASKIPGEMGRGTSQTKNNPEIDSTQVKLKQT